MRENKFHSGPCDGQGRQDLDGLSDRPEKKEHPHPWEAWGRPQEPKEGGAASELDFLLLHQLRHCGHMMHHHHNDNQSQNRILLCLNHNGTMSQKQLAEHMRIQAGSLSEVVAKVEAGGYIMRRRCQEDRRAVELYLTEKGKAQAVQYEKEQDARTARMFACLTQEEKEQLSEILGRMLRSWDADR